MDPTTMAIAGATGNPLMALGGGIDTGGGAITPSSSASAKNGDMYARGPTIQGMSIGATSGVSAGINYAFLAVMILIVLVVLWKK
jgi:hypothetical protein